MLNPNSLENSSIRIVEANTGQSVLAETPIRKRCCRLSPVLTLMLIGIAALAILVFFAHQSTQTVPEFYQVALDIAPEAYRAAGEEFETQILQLNSDVRSLEHWHATFSTDQVNGWLAFELPENFPGTIPPEITEPRVHFTEEEIQLAFKFVSPHFSGIVTASGNVFCTGETNQIAIQIRSARSGIVPLPIDMWADSIKEGCTNAGIDLTWSQKDGCTLAIVNLPEQFLDIHNRKITLESISVVEEQVVLAGTSLPLTPESSSSQSQRMSSDLFDTKPIRQQDELR